MVCDLMLTLHLPEEETVCIFPPSETRRRLVETGVGDGFEWELECKLCCGGDDLGERKPLPPMVSGVVGYGLVGVITDGVGGSWLNDDLLLLAYNAYRQHIF